MEAATGALSGQTLFGRLQQLASVAGDVLLGKEKIGMSSRDIKGFYRQKKKGSVGVTKPSAPSSKKSKQYTGGASVGIFVTTQTPALVCRGRHGERHDSRCGKRTEEEKWALVTKLGRLVKADQITSTEQIYLHSLFVKKHQIVECFLKGLKDEVMKITPVQKQTCAGQRTRSVSSLS
jgi:hypothetical protein